MLRHHTQLLCTFPMHSRSSNSQWHNPSRKFLGKTRLNHRFNKSRHRCHLPTNSKADGSCAHLHLNKRRYFTVLFRTLDFIVIFVHSFDFVSDTFLVLYFYIQISLHVQLLPQMQKNPNKGRDITPDIFTLKMTCTSWRQITFTFNKPAPLGAKILRVLHWKCSSPFYS